ncbi:fibulin-1-like [Wyeomyia smithii]|uniref:fibulin-1-like n=1 Tax=Wyeomyia smithii TaxID=174621 RepID=UPI0024680C37|nr:fibulin-1-like [Wyeomyia smithii]
MIGRDRRCEDIDECDLNTGTLCPQNSDCINTVGSYQCSCKVGFWSIRSEKLICSKVDECSGLCQQRCITFWGSYRCGCKIGYKLAADNRTCDDINVCEEYKAHFICDGHCENTPGSYRCRCPQGYTLGHDERSCVDINECGTGDACSDRNEICTNIPGSYRCTQINCPGGYVISPKRKNECLKIKIESCDKGDLECLQTPSSYSYYFLAMVSSMPVPPTDEELSTIQYEWSGLTEFELKVLSVNALPSVRLADDNISA